MSDDEGADEPFLGEPIEREDGLSPCFKCKVVKLKGGFGFNIKGPTADGGQMLSIAGVLLPPLQYISAVENGGAAWRGGLRVNDRVLVVNGTDVMGRSHADIVELVVKGGASLELDILRISKEEAERMARLEEAAERGTTVKPMDSSGVAVRGYAEKATPSPHTVYKIYYKGVKCASRRFSEFVKLHKDLQARFRWYTFPPFPKKLTNGLFGGSISEPAKKQRAAELHQFMSKVMSNEDIINSEISCTFLCIKPPGTNDGSVAASSPPLAHEDDTSAPPTPAAKITPSTNASPAAEPARKSGQKLFGEATVFDEEEEGGIDDLTPPFEEEKPAAAPKPKTKKTSKPAEASSKKSTGENKAIASVLDDDDDEPLPPSKPKAKPVKKDKPAAAAAASVEKKEDEGPTVAVEVPGRDPVTVPLPPKTTVAAVEAALATKLKLGPFASKAFGLFVLLKEGSLLRKLPPNRKVAKALDHGDLVYRKWLFAKAQEVNIDADAAGAMLLRECNREDVAAGTLNADTIKAKLDEAEQGADPKKYNKALRKLRLYNALAMRPCVCDFPSKGTNVVVSLHLARLVLTTCDGEGTPSVAEDDVTEFPWESLTGWAPNDDGSAIVVTYTTADDEEESVTVELGEDVPYFTMCAKRVMLEREWLQQLANGDDLPEGNFFVKKK